MPSRQSPQRETFVRVVWPSSSATMCRRMSGATALRPRGDGMPLRGSDGRRDRASDRPRVSRPQSGKGVHPLRHGAVPGPDVRDGGERDVCRAPARRRRSDRALRHPSAGQAPDRWRACGAGRNRHDAGRSRQHSDSTEGCANLSWRCRFSSPAGGSLKRSTPIFRQSNWSSTSSAHRPSSNYHSSASALRPASMQRVREDARAGDALRVRGGTHRTPRSASEHEPNLRRSGECAPPPLR